MSIASKILARSGLAIGAAFGVLTIGGQALAQSTGLSGAGAGAGAASAASPRPAIGDRGISMRAGVLYGAETNAFPANAPGAARLDPEFEYITANATVSAKQPVGPVQLELIGSVSQRDGTEESALNATTWDAGLTSTAALGSRCGGVASARVGERQVDFEIVDAITRSLVETQRYQVGVACALPFNLTASLSGTREQGRAADSADRQAQADFDQDVISGSLSYQATRRLAFGVNLTQTRRELVNPALAIAAAGREVELTSYTAFAQFNPSARLSTQVSIGSDRNDVTDDDSLFASANAVWRLSSRTELTAAYSKGQFQRQDSVALLSDGESVRVGAQWRPNRRLRLNLEWLTSQESVVPGAVPAGFTLSQLRESADIDQFSARAGLRLTRWAELTLSYRTNSTKARPAIYDLDNDVVQIGISVER